MPHKKWCGNPCFKCESPCNLDQNILCSPDCSNLSPDGKMDTTCTDCDAYKLNHRV